MRKTLTASIFCAFAVFVFFIGPTLGKSVSRVKQQPTRDFPQVKNKTQSFRFVSADRLEGLIRLNMRNESKKGVTGYLLAFGKTSEIETDLVISNRVIAPGEVEEILFPDSSLNDSAASGEPNTVTVALVVFEDRSSEGDFQADTRIRSKRLGIRAQLQLINQRLRAAILPSRSGSLSLRNLKDQVSSLPDRQNEHETESFRSGLDFARQWIVLLLGELESWEANKRSTLLRMELSGAKDVPSAIEKLITYNEKLINKY